jgi:hypothetical protein
MRSLVAVQKAARAVSEDKRGLEQGIDHTLLLTVIPVGGQLHILIIALARFPAECSAVYDDSP